MGERPTIPGTAEWPDVPLGRAMLAVNTVKSMHGGEGERLRENEDALLEYVRLVLTASGESGIEPEDLVAIAAMAGENYARSAVDRSRATGEPIDIGSLAHSLWIDGCLHGIAVARRLWADEETGVVELRPEEESDDAR
jgi:hypothetical protein